MTVCLGTNSDTPDNETEDVVDSDVVDAGNGDMELDADKGEVDYEADSALKPLEKADIPQCLENVFNLPHVLLKIGITQ